MKKQSSSSCELGWLLTFLQGTFDPQKMDKFELLRTGPTFRFSQGGWGSQETTVSNFFDLTKFPSFSGSRRGLRKNESFSVSILEKLPHLMTFWSGLRNWEVSSDQIRQNFSFCSSYVYPPENGKLNPCRSALSELIPGIATRSDQKLKSELLATVLLCRFPWASFRVPWEPK